MYVGYKTKFKFIGNGYIAHPYWVERAEVIDIVKRSGTNRCRSEEKRQQTLRAYLEKEGLTMEDYQNLCELSERQWYRQDGTKDGVIVIPRHQLSGCLTQACQSAPSGSKYKPDQLRSLVSVSDFVTEKTKCDGVFKRFVKLETSNQRSAQSNEFIKDFEAEGTVTIDPEVTDADSIKVLLQYAGKHIGVGASRKMGYGRFTVTQFEPE